MPVLFFPFVAKCDEDSSSWGGRSSPALSLGSQRSPLLTKRLAARRHKRLSAGNHQLLQQSCTANTTSTDNSLNNENNHRQRIEVGTEANQDHPEDTKCREKLDPAAIVVDGKEELPTSIEALMRKQRSLRERRRRRFSSCSEMNRSNNHLGVEGAASNHSERNGVSEDEGSRDRNANSRMTRRYSSYHSVSKESATLPRIRRRRALSISQIDNPLPPHRVTPDGTAIYYWCELPRRPGSQGNLKQQQKKKKRYPVT